MDPVHIDLRRLSEAELTRLVAQFEASGRPGLAARAKAELRERRGGGGVGGERLPVHRTRRGRSSAAPLAAMVALVALATPTLLGENRLARPDSPLAARSRADMARVAPPPVAAPLEPALAATSQMSQRPREAPAAALARASPPFASDAAVEPTPGLGVELPEMMPPPPIVARGPQLTERRSNGVLVSVAGRPAVRRACPDGLGCGVGRDALAPPAGAERLANSLAVADAAPKSPRASAGAPR